MRLFRVLYSAILLTISAGLGFAAYIFMTPVTPANFDMRVSAMCETSNLAGLANERFGLTSVSVPRLNCVCMKSRLLAQNGTDGTVRLAETTRQLFVNSMRRQLTGQPQSLSRFNDGDIRRIETFLTGLQRACPAR